MKYLFTLILFFLVYSVQAQYDTLFISVLPFATNSAKNDTYVQAAENLVVEALASDHRVVLLERNAVDASDAVVREREYQKSEDFIDGKIVEQGKAIGAEYLVEGFYDSRVKQFTIKMFDVSDATLKGASVVNSNTKEKQRSSKLLNGLAKLEKALNAFDPTSSSSSTRVRAPNGYQMEGAVEQLMKDCFGEPFIYVIRATDESKKKAKRLLIAGGSNMGLRKGKLVSVQATVFEEVNGTKIERLEEIGWGRVDEVESETFSILQIQVGTKEIKKCLAEGQQLICKIVKR